jgi:hypothetical protein
LLCFRGAGVVNMKMQILGTLRCVDWQIFTDVSEDGYAFLYHEDSGTAVV